MTLGEDYERFFREEAPDGERYGRIVLRRPADVVQLGFADFREFTFCISNALHDNPLEQRRLDVWREKDGTKRGLLRSFPELQRLQRAGDISGNDFEVLEAEAREAEERRGRVYPVKRARLTFDLSPTPKLWPADRRQDLAVEVEIVIFDLPPPDVGDVLPWASFGLGGLPGDCIVTDIATERHLEIHLDRVVGPYCGNFRLELRPLNRVQADLIRMFAPASRNLRDAEAEHRLFLGGLAASLGFPPEWGEKL